MPQTWQPKPPTPSPSYSTGWLGWARKNLFSSPGNALLTLLSLAVLLATLPSMLRWGLWDATWLGDSRKVCDSAAQDGSAGACWVFIKVRLEVFLYGFYPEAQRWRVNFTLALLGLAALPILAPTLLRGTLRQTLFALAAALLMLATFGMPCAIFTACYLLLPLALPPLVRQRPFLELFAGRLAGVSAGLFLTALAATLLYLAAGQAGGGGAAGPIAVTGAILVVFLIFVGRLTASAWRWILLFTVYPLAGFFLLVGEVFGLPLVETHFWGGLFLTLVVAGTGMATALPIGILLALGRRSALPVIKTLCVFFIEFVRGVPLVSVLFMASVMFPLFLPENVTFDKLLRALIGIAFFYAAYMAEVIRGGLQAIPKGQFEAAMALGWPYWKMMALIIMPQTLRLVIPGLANNVLSLLKDTTLVAVIGLLDLLGVAKASMADTEWLGFTKEAYIFAALVFWVFCFAISRYSVYLEKTYHTSQHYN